MLDTTRTAAAAIFKADPTMTDEERKARLAPNLTITDTEPLDRIIPPVETGKLLGGKDRHTLLDMARRGLLVAVRGGRQGKNVTGYTLSSVRAFLSGKANANANGKAVQA
jgi:hypothetical protein